MPRPATLCESYGLLGPMASLCDGLCGTTSHTNMATNSCTLVQRDDHWVQKLPDVDKVPNFAQIVKWFVLCYVNNMFIWYDVYMFVVSQNSGGYFFNGDPLYWARSGNAVKIQGAQVLISGNLLGWGWAKRCIGLYRSRIVRWSTLDCSSCRIFSIYLIYRFGSSHKPDSDGFDWQLTYWNHHILTRITLRNKLWNYFVQFSQHSVVFETSGDHLTKSIATMQLSTPIVGQLLRIQGKTGNGALFCACFGGWGGDSFLSMLPYCFHLLS